MSNAATHPTGVVRTRIAPSPTGYLHLGTARTALYSWAYARHHGGQFVLRIEDTDVARSTQESVEQILQSMHWLGLDYDEGPIYQMQRLDRYQQVIDQMLANGTAYRCYATPEELDAMREAQKARGEKTLYDRRWRPEPGKTLPTPPEGVKPVIRFANPVEGDVTWDDIVKGPITINNREIDDLIIIRPAEQEGALGVPTYNFAVVVDDWDMGITHVFRGDEHINNTPWQINLYQALGAAQPLVLIMGADAFTAFNRWHRWRDIFALAHIAVAHRPGAALMQINDTALQQAFLQRRTDNGEAVHRAPAGCVIEVPITALDISATAIRGLLQARRSARYLMPPAVLEYIEHNYLF